MARITTPTLTLRFSFQFFFLDINHSFNSQALRSLQPLDRSLTGSHRDRIHAIARRLHPIGFIARTFGERVRVGSLLHRARGPDHVWSVHAYCKLELFGIQIYACIDVYSRCIIWAYIGTMAKTVFSMFCQYLTTVHELGRTLQLMRADHRVETPMMVDAHLLFREHQEGRNLQFNEAFWYTTSEGIHTIEHWWSEGAKTAINTCALRSLLYTSLSSGR